MKTSLLIIAAATAALLSGCQSTTPADSSAKTVTSAAKTQPQAADLKFTYLDMNRLLANQQKVMQKDAIYVEARKAIVQKANAAVKRKLDPVTNKPKAGPSGDLHDYLSIGPYWWPDESKADGLPWIRKDGVVNPKTRGKHTDKQRSGNFLHDLGYLNIAYLYNTDRNQYLVKMKELIHAWLIDPKTRMNPNLDYAQGVPGASTGRPFGVIEFEKISNVVTSIELLEQTGTAEPSFIAKSNAWLSEYLNWLLTSKIGQQEGATKNNHANWYDHQVMGLMLHLKQTEKAKEYAATLKSKRIDPQIKPDGSQPLELARTKSVNYSSMNLMAFLQNAELAEKVGVDLLHYSGDKGQSIKAAVNYLIPYVQGKKKWEYKQLGGVEKAFKKKTYSPLFIAHKLYGSSLVPDDLIQENMQYVQAELILTY